MLDEMNVEESGLGAPRPRRVAAAAPVPVRAAPPAVVAAAARRVQVMAVPGGAPPPPSSYAVPVPSRRVAAAVAMRSTPARTAPPAVTAAAAVRSASYAVPGPSRVGKEGRTAPPAVTAAGTRRTGAPIVRRVPAPRPPPAPAVTPPTSIPCDNDPTRSWIPGVEYAVDPCAAVAPPPPPAPGGDDAEEFDMDFGTGRGAARARRAYLMDRRRRGVPLPPPVVVTPPIVTPPPPVVTPGPGSTDCPPGEFRWTNGECHSTPGGDQTNTGGGVDVGPTSSDDGGGADTGGDGWTPDGGAPGPDEVIATDAGGDDASGAAITPDDNVLPDATGGGIVVPGDTSAPPSDTLGDWIAPSDVLTFANPRYWVGKGIAELKDKYATAKSLAQQKVNEFNEYLGRYAAAKNDLTGQVKFATLAEGVLTRRGDRAGAARIAAARRQAVAVRDAHPFIDKQIADVRAKLNEVNGKGAGIRSPGLGIVGVDDAAALIVIIAGMFLVVSMIAVVSYYITKHIRDVILNRQQLDAVAHGTLSSAEYSALKREELKAAPRGPIESLGSLVTIAGVAVAGYFAIQLFGKRRAA